jgi:hypothetical protein
MSPEDDKAQGNELYSIDAQGNKQDAHIHEGILAGDHDAAVEVTREWARKNGFLCRQDFL